MNKRIKKKHVAYYGNTRLQFRREYIKLLRSALRRIERGCGDAYLKYIQENMTSEYTIDNDITLHKIKHMSSIANATKIPIEYIAHPEDLIYRIHKQRQEYKRGNALTQST